MPRILLIDDMIDMLEEEAKLLRECDLDYEVDTASSGALGLKALSENPPYDLVILDLMMPNKSGLEVLHEIKRRFKCKVVIYSAYLERITPQMLYEEGADKVLSKPSPLNLFLNTVQSLTENDKNTTVMIVRGFKIKDIRRQIVAILLQKVLRLTGGNVTKCAKLLGVSRECVYNLIKKYDVCQ